ncbi:MAG TPA: SAM-dependent methyltransferase [Candidatus Eremiobacteraceae bacterium]|nr:SAM-dependent methyltransferase [Candidatus Eremiobacteraceae bacterium]
MPDLTIVGAGIDVGRDLTPAARWHIERADKVFSLVGDAVAARTVDELNANNESLAALYDVEKPRIDTYDAMIARILACVRGGSKVCVVAYGHPGVFAYPMHKALAGARAAGYTAALLPAISSIDCLLADLDVDPAADGLQIFDASDLLLNDRSFSLTAPLVLLQVAVTGDPSFKIEYGREGVARLAKHLSARYGPAHPAIVYEAAQYSGFAPTVERTTLSALEHADITTGSTLFVPPKREAAIGEEVP